jgi:hypothetical protein
VPVVVDPSERPALRSMLERGERALVATLEETPGADGVAPLVVVRVQGTARGRFDREAAARHLPLVRALRSAGLPATCAATLTEHRNDVGLACSLADPAALLEW